MVPLQENQSIAKQFLLFVKKFHYLFSSVAAFVQWKMSNIGLILALTALFWGQQPLKILIWKEACKAFPGQIAVGIDARKGMVATEDGLNNLIFLRLNFLRNLKMLAFVPLFIQILTVMVPYKALILTKQPI